MDVPKNAAAGVVETSSPITFAISDNDNVLDPRFPNFNVYPSSQHLQLVGLYIMLDMHRTTTTFATSHIRFKASMERAKVC
jgi:hypothetical protein